MPQQENLLTKPVYAAQGQFAAIGQIDGDYYNVVDLCILCVSTVKRNSEKTDGAQHAHIKGRTG